MYKLLLKQNNYYPSQTCAPLPCLNLGRFVCAHCSEKEVAGVLSMRRHCSKAQQDSSSGCKYNRASRERARPSYTTPYETCTSVLLSQKPKAESIHQLF